MKAFRKITIYLDRMQFLIYFNMSTLSLLQDSLISMALKAHLILPNNINLILAMIRLPQNIDEQETMQSGQIEKFYEQSQQITIISATQMQDIYYVISSFFSKRSKQIYMCLLVISSIIHIKNYLYFLDITVCPYQDFNKCLNEYFIPLGQNQESFGPYIYNNMICFLFQFHVLLQGKVHRSFSIASLIAFAWQYILGNKEANIFNMIGLLKSVHIALLINLLIIYFLVYGLYLIWKKGKYFKTIFFGIFLILILTVVYLKQTKECNDWGEGINGRIENENGMCKMIIPNCYILKAIAWTNFNYLYHNCFLGKGYKMEYNGYFSKDIENGTIIGFHDFKHMTDIEASSDNIYQKIYSRARRFKSLEEAKKSDKKYDVLFDTEQQRYHIEINRNDTLVKQKMQRWNKYQQSSSPPLTKNVLFIFMDAVSRFQVSLKLPKVFKWFKQRSVYHSYRQQIIGKIGSEKKVQQTYQFYRFLSVASWTVANIFPMSYGSPHNKTFYGRFKDRIGLALPQNDTLNHRLQHFLQYYDQRGFITGTTHSYCTPCLDQMFQTHIPEFKFPQFDHQTLSYNCDPNFISMNNTFDYLKGINAVTDRCLYHKRLAEYNIDHAESFFKKYEKQPKFYMLNFMEGHALMGGSLKYIDPDIEGFLSRLQERGTLEDTSIILISDHGQHLSSYPSVIADHFNPVLMVYLPKKMNEIYRDKIKRNQQNTVSMYNVHHFLRHLAEGQSYEKKNLGLLGDLSLQKTCEDVLVYKNEEYPYCYCR